MVSAADRTTGSTHRELVAQAANRDIVLIGASAGGIETLRKLLAELPVDLEAAVLVVLHLPSAATSALSAVLARATHLPVVSASDGMPLLTGQVIVGVPDHHLVIRDGRVHLGRGPHENGHRPAVDPLFRSGARWHGRHAVAVVLSGALDDGAAGARTVHRRGGVVVVQNPEDALHAGMPNAALAAVPDAEVLPLTRIAARIVELVSEPLGPRDPGHPTTTAEDERLTVETGVAELDPASLGGADRPGTPSGLACPDCHGVLFEIEEGAGFVRYRCRVGHAWSPESLLVEQNEELETALWMALRALEERAALDRRIAAAAAAAGRPTVAEVTSERATEAARSADLVRDLLLRPDTRGEIRG